MTSIKELAAVSPGNIKSWQFHNDNYFEPIKCVSDNFGVRMCRLSVKCEGETKTVDRTATAFTFQGYHAKQTNSCETKTKTHARYRIGFDEVACQ